MKIKLISEEPKSILSAPFTMPVYLTLLDCMPSESLADLTDGLDTIEILIWKSKSQSYLQDRSFKLFGMVLPSSLEDSLLPKFIKKNTSILPIPFWIKEEKLYWVKQVIHQFWCVPLSALIWVASQFHIWELITDTFASATVQCTTSSAEYDKVQPFKTCHILTILFTKKELCFASRKWSTQESHQLLFGRD